MQGTPKREIFHVAGDAPDPTGGAARGLAPGYDLTATAAGHPLLFYRLPNDHELILEADVYQLPDVAMHIHLICPLCMMAGRTVGLTITQGNKEMQFERQVAPKPPPGWKSFAKRRPMTRVPFPKKELD